MPLTLRRPLLAFVLVALTCVWVVPGPQQPAAQGLAHELVHLQAVSHHHHDDASLHLDDAATGESPSHQHAGDGTKPVAWVVAAPVDAGPRLPHPLVAAAEPHSLAVVLDGPLRPPRA